MSVTVFGSLNLDIALHLPERASWGQTLLVAKSAEAVGGKGMNQAVAAARFGSVTRMAGAVGADTPGTMLRAALVADGVDVTHVDILDAETSGRATILIEPSGENMIIVEAGANRLARTGAGIAALNGDSRVLLIQLETDIDVIAALLRSPAAAPVRKILNVAPAIPEAAPLFDLADMIIFNQTEFATYMGLDREPETVEELLVGRRILSKHNQAFVVTLGAIGSVAVWADRTMFSPAIPAASVVDTSGAGDCFCGIVAACVDQGIGPEQALAFANAGASIVVGRYGAAPSMPMRNEVDALIAAQ